MKISLHCRCPHCRSREVARIPRKSWMRLFAPIRLKRWHCLICGNKFLTVLTDKHGQSLTRRVQGVFRESP